MFGFSLQKIILLAGIIGAVWYGFKLAKRLQDARDRDGLATRRQKPRWTPNRRRSKDREPDVAETEDMVQCPTCRAYVAARNTNSCGRDDCPY